MHSERGQSPASPLAKQHNQQEEYSYEHHDTYGNDTVRSDGEG